MSQALATAPKFEVLAPQTEAAQRISHAYADARGHALTALRKVVVCGLLLIEQKEKVKHGEFGPWIAKNCPEIEWRTAQTWMSTAVGVCKILQIRSGIVFDDLTLYQMLELPAAELSDKARAVQESVFGLVDGKSQKQLLFEFKDFSPAPKPANGSKIKSQVVDETALAMQTLTDQIMAFEGTLLTAEFFGALESHSKHHTALVQRLADNCAIFITQARKLKFAK